jgi:hypothetical protein
MHAQIFRANSPGTEEFLFIRTHHILPHRSRPAPDGFGNSLVKKPIWLSSLRPGFLDLPVTRGQTPSMAHIYMVFEFAKDEEKAQQARHKLETWKQAFRLDKKLLYKLGRSAVPADGEEAKPAKEVKAKDEKPKGKGKSTAKSAAKTEAPESAPSSNEDVRLLVRLGFSGHEKLTEQRWLQRIPSEEPFNGASPTVIKQGEANFAETAQQFEDLA